MIPVRTTWLGLVVVCATGLLITSCSGTSSEVKNDPLMNAKNAPKDIFTAAKSGDLDRARELIDKGDWDATEMDGRGMRPLDCAVEGGNADIVRLMIEHGANKNMPGPKGTPLAFAKKLGKKDVEQALTELGATE